MKTVLLHDRPLSGNGNHTTAVKRIGRGRIAGLSVIALLTLGLSYLHFAGGSKAVSVPSGAHAGQLTLKHCTYGNEPADCGTLVVPENRHDPHSRLIALPITRIHAQRFHPGTPIFRLQGGPGLTNMDFPTASRFTARHDFVLVGYRGVDGSSRLDCPEVVNSLEHSRDFLSTASLESEAAAYSACAKRLQREGVDLAGYSLPERVDDLELARHELGYGKIDLLSESAGTRTAMIYAWRYPQSIHRSVMISANPPGHYLFDPKTTGQQIHRYAALCAQTSDCRSRTSNLTASVHSAYRNIPSRWLFLPIKKGNVRVAAFFGLNNATTDGGGPIAAPRTLDTLFAIDKGDGAGAWLFSVFAGLAFPRGQVWGEVAATGRTDAECAKQYFASHADRGSVIGAPGSDLLYAGGRLLNAWPANPDENEYAHVQDSQVPTLLVGGALDFAAPPQNATRELLPHLLNGHQVVLPNLGHADDFWAYESAASTRLIDTFLDKGRVDTSLYTKNQLDFSPSTTHGTVATIVLAVFLSLAAAAILSLLWIGTRLARGKMFGRKGSFVTRSLLALLVGSGSWCLGVLITLIAFPTVPIDDQTLAILSISPPVAAVVYSGWLRRAAPLGLAALVVVSTAALGAWLGFHVPHTPALGAVTAIVGAILASNLGLSALDIAVPAARIAPQPVSPHAETLAGPT
ncbi:MAG TPA: alpha/beta fold hydrolase [Gaiellaceae bacterium]|nr:alpha/beta fold hydrolase [Gaiellaceae bacterium]